MHISEIKKVFNRMRLVKSFSELEQFMWNTRMVFSTSSTGIAEHANLYAMDVLKTIGLNTGTGGSGADGGVYEARFFLNDWLMLLKGEKISKIFKSMCKGLFFDSIGWVNNGTY